jgi:hypothetical protein
MRDPVMTISLPGPSADAAGDAGGAWPATTSGGGSVLCAKAGVVAVASAAIATPVQRIVFVRFI